MSLYSMEKMKDSDEADVVVSFDCHMPNRSHLYNRYRSSFRSLRFVDSYQINFQRDAWTDERVARHWVSAITRVLSVHPRVVYLEEDHVVMPDFIEAVDHYKNENCSACFEVDIGCHPPCKSELSNMGVIYFQHTWMEFLENGFERWCSRRGDWDHNLRKYTEEVKMGAYRADRTHVKHLHDCVSARTKRLHKKGVYCGKDRRMQLYREFLEEWEKDKEKPFGGEIVTSHKTVNNPGAPARMKEMCLGSIGSHHKIKAMQRNPVPAHGTRVSYNICPGSSISLEKTASMAVYLRGDIVSDHIRGGSMFEKHIICPMLEYMKKAPDNSAFIDVGGNVGAWTIAIAALFPRIPVLTVEPLPPNAELLRWSLSENKMSSVTLVQSALAQRPGKDMCMWSTHGTINRGNARLVPLFEGVKDFGDDKRKTCDVRVRTETLDDIYERELGMDTRVWAMKIDIEGYETRALAGSLKMLKAGRPCRIWFEYQKKVTLESGAGEYELFELLASFGYDIYVVLSGGELKRVVPPSWGGQHIFDGVAIAPLCHV